MALITYHLQDIDTLEGRLEEFRKVFPNKGKVSISKVSELPINYEYLFLPTVKGLEYVVKTPYAFDLLKTAADYYSIKVNNEVPDQVIPTLEKKYEGIGKQMGKIIYEAGLIA